MRRFFLSVGLLMGIAVQAGAQVVTDGTDPSAPVGIVANPGDASWLNQAFVAKGDQLTSLTIWFYGGTWNTPQMEDHYARLQLWSGWTAYGPTLTDLWLDQSNQGELTITFATPLALTLGGQYTFSLFSNNCGAIAMGGCFSHGLQPGPENKLPAIAVTTVDAYADGYYWVGRETNADTGRDIRFVATYAVPEPETLGLSVLTTALFAMQIRRRRLFRSASDNTVG